MTAECADPPTGVHTPWRSIALASMTALAYEILLMRLFSIVQWHHFAYMIISLALLGYGASGTFIALFRARLLRHYRQVYLTALGLFGVTSLMAFVISQTVSFNIEEILWDPGQVVRLVGIYFVLAMPFFFVATAIGLTLSYHADYVARIYSADLSGAGLGSILIILLFYSLLPGTILVFISCMALVAATVAAFELLTLKKAIKTGSLFGLLILVILSLPAEWTRLNMSPYKALSQTLNMAGTRIIDTRSSPLGLLHVVESTRMPFRQAPGLSLVSSSPIPDQLGVFIDADAMTPITAYRSQQDLSYLDQTTSALPYHLAGIHHALVLGAGGGTDVLQALSHDAQRVTAVELDAQIIDLVKNRFNDYAGQIYNHERVQVVQAEAREFIVSRQARYDLIALSMFDSYSASSAGLYALSESYLYTVEALQSYFEHLTDEGFVVINRWVRLPPRDTLKLFNTAIEALNASGVEQPGRHLLAVRGLQTSTLVIKKSPVSAVQIEALREFGRKYAFDPIFYWHMPAVEANRFNQLAEPYFYQGAKALLSDQREAFVSDYKFNIQPATDDRPFFFQFFRWMSFSEIIGLMGQGGMPLIEWGYLILVATLLQALATSLLLILLPLWFARNANARMPTGIIRLHGLVYFLALGVGFMFMEIAFIQKFILFLYHPTFAVAVVLASFLIFAGLGSRWSHAYITSGRFRPGVDRAIGAIMLIGMFYLVTLQYLFEYLMVLPVFIKMLVSVLLIAPLAFFMGMPFAIGIAGVSKIHAGLVPWVWGVNGCASVISAVLASLLAIHVGFSWVVVFAVAFYFMALLSARYWMPVQQ